MSVTYISGGVTAARGFSAGGIHCGLRKNTDRKDLALIAADTVCTAAGVFTTNKVFAAPVGLCRRHLLSGTAQAIIVNSGNANACTPDGDEKAEASAEALAKAMNIKADDVLVASTGVIGQPLPLEPLVSGIPALIADLTSDDAASDRAASAIMTTDTRKKEVAVSFTLGGKTAVLGGICKGAGMIHPQMGTMLSFLTTDAAVDAAALKTAIKDCADLSFNMVSVDGDTSTNDTLVVLASGKAGNETVTVDSPDYPAFREALLAVCTYLAKAIAADGEGATRLLECNVTGFSDYEGARVLAKSVIRSPLVKSAMFGADANWGRIICALGYSGVTFDPEKVTISFTSAAGSLKVCENGRSYPFSEELAKKVLSEKSIVIDCAMNAGDQSATAWGCDLTYEYVRINGDYRS